MRAFPQLRDFLFRLRYGFRGVPLEYGGQKIRLDESLRRWNSTSEFPMQKLMLELLRPGGCMLDVGANFGIHSLLAGKLVGPSGKVYAFEPVPDNLAKLRHHLALNHLEKIVQIVPTAVSNSPEKQISFYSGADESEVTASLSGSSGNPKQLQVPNTRVDDFIASINHPVRLVKIDVEGAEVEVLRGSQKLLKRDRPFLIIEVHAYAFADFQTSIIEYKTLIDSMDYDEEIIPGTILKKDLHYQTLCRPRNH